jgi:hypothetical protein
MLFFENKKITNRQKSPYTWSMDIIDHEFCGLKKNLKKKIIKKQNQP